MPTDYREFAKTVKSKYPQYKDVDDLELAQKMVEKFPEYKSKVTFDEVKKKRVYFKGYGIAFETRRHSIFIGYKGQERAKAFGFFCFRKA